MPIITFQTTLRRALGLHTFEMQAGAGTVRQLLLLCEQELGKPVLPHLVNREGELLRGVMLLVNGKNVLLLQGLETVVQPEDTVIIFPPAGGG